MISEEIEQEAGENRKSVISLREKGRKFHKWIDEGEILDFENEEV